MDPVNTAGDSDLQKAINDITNAATMGQDGGVQDTVPVAVGTDASVGDGDASAVAAPTEVALPTDVAAPVEEAPLDFATPAIETAGVGADFGTLKTDALAELKPILKTVDLAPEAKFKIYKEIIATTNDKDAVGLAYEEAKNIATDKEKAEALLFVIETIDRMS